MKIYRFDQETGAYLGEDFADEAMIEHGRFLVPADATTVAPPDAGGRGVFFFNSSERCWELRCLSPDRQNCNST